MSARRILPICTLLFALVAVVGCGQGNKPRDEGRIAGDPALCDTTTHAVEDGPFLPLDGGDTSLATATGGWNIVREGECERFTLALLKGDGAPGHAGPLNGAVLRSDGIVRITIPGVLDAVADPDSAFASPLVTAAYVVHARDGSFYEDIHLAQPAYARRLALANPARIGIDLSPGGGAVPTPAPRARNVVVLQPRAGAQTYPLVIRGYARTFEANVVARLATGDQVLARAQGTAADYATTWGEFELTIPKGPSGDMKLFVGEDSAENGTPVGVTIPLTMAGGPSGPPKNGR